MSTRAAITHIALFWLKTPGSDADRAALVAGIRTLGVIDVVSSCAIGQAAATEARDAVDHSFDVSEILTFASAADQLAYQNHPVHLKFVEDCGHLWDRVQVYDIAAIT